LGIEPPWFAAVSADSQEHPEFRQDAPGELRNQSQAQLGQRMSEQNSKSRGYRGIEAEETASLMGGQLDCPHIPLPP
jgi:hypothetical protein